MAWSRSQEAVRAELAADLLDDLRRADGQLREAKKKLEAAVRATGTSLTEIFGVGPVIAATVIGEAGDVPRFAGRDAFASYNGTAPIEVSSGRREVFRLSLRGNRRLNHAAHMTAVTQVRYSYSEGRAYYDKKIAEGKTPKEALRALKRQVSDAFYKHLKADAGRAESGRANGERLCRQRGRLTPQDAGSSARPLPDQDRPYAQGDRNGVTTLHKLARRPTAPLDTKRSRSVRPAAHLVHSRE